MDSLPILTVLEQSQVSPPPATIGDNVLSLTYFDFWWLNKPPIHYIFFYELKISKPQFIDSIIPNIKHSFSITLQHFYPLAGNLIIFPSQKQKPEIRYHEGDSVAVTFAECNLYFNELTANHPRNCEMFYHLIPLLGHADKSSDSLKIPVFAVQVTVFPNHGISIGMTHHHSLGDANIWFYFMKVWTSIARFGTDELFLDHGTLPCYDRVINNPKLDESYLKFVKVETLYQEYQPPRLSGPTDKVRVTLVLTRTMLDGLKKYVSTHLASLVYVSSFTVACGYIWSCIAKSRNDERHLFGFTIDCRDRMDPPIPANYFGNCVGRCLTIEKASLLRGKEGFITAAKLLGENLHKTLNESGGIVKEMESYSDLFSEGMPTTMIGVAGTPKLKFYDMDFGFGKPVKIETVSIDYGTSISMNACKDSNQDIEIAISLSATEMEVFLRAFDEGLKDFIVAS